MGVLGFILGYGNSGRGVKVDANGAIIANAGSGTHLPLSYGDTGRASAVDASGRLMINLDGTGGAVTATGLPIVDASGYYPTHNAEAAFALAGRNNRTLRTDVSKQRTDFTNSSGVFVSTIAAKVASISSAGGTTWVQAATGVLKGLTAGTGVKLTAGTNDITVDVKDFANASGSYIKTITGSSGIIATKSGSSYAIKEQMLIAKPFKTLTAVSGNMAVDLAQYNNYYMAMGVNNTTFNSLTNPTDGGKYLFVFKQNNAGSKTITFSDAKVKWVGGTAIALTAASGSVDACTLVYCSPLSIYIAAPGLDIK